MSADEMIEEVDSAGRVIRLVTRAEMRARRLRHRAVFVAVLSTDGRLLAHRRSDDKDLWPSRWDVCAGGVVGAGEDWDDAATRELAEELGIEGEALERLGPVSYEDADVALVGMAYVARSDGPYRFADGEVVEARLVDRGELDDLLARAATCPDSVTAVLPLLLDRLS